MKSGYMIFNINVNNPENYSEYVDKVKPIAEKYGGEYIVRGGENMVIEGNWQYPRTVVIKFPSYAKAIEFYEEALQQAGEHSGYMLNIAITQFMMGNKGLAKQKYDEVVLIDKMFEGKLDKVFGAAKASMIAGDSDGPKVTISEDLEAELAEGSSKGLVEIKDAPKDIEPDDIKKIDFRKRRARSDNTVGITFARLGNYSMAIDYFKKAVQNDPDEMDYKVNLAVGLYRMYKYEDAIYYYEEVKKA